jgi:hypothetical protein
LFCLTHPNLVRQITIFVTGDTATLVPQMRENEMRNFCLILLLLLPGMGLLARTTTVSTVTELKNAISLAEAGDTIWVAEGIYAISTLPGISITRSGTIDAPIRLLAEAGSRPIFDFSGQSRNNSSARGLALKASYWHIHGIDFSEAGDNGMIIADGHFNVVEQCRFYSCNDTGLQIDNGSSNNLILNCDSYFNADATNENADGFAAKLGVGDLNKFKGCRAWRNLDDGFDGYLRGANNITTLFEDVWVIENGYNNSGVAGIGDGNGFKTGGSDDKTLKHHAMLTRCIAIGNRVKGFDHNSNRGDVTLYHCGATANGTNMGFGSTNPVNLLTIKNSVVVGVTGNLNATTKNITHNSWNGGVVADAFDYENFNNYYDQMTAPRKSDGSLPDVAFWQLVPTSDLVDAGTDLGLAFSGEAPDMGPFEHPDNTSSIRPPATEKHGKLVSEKYFSITGQPVSKNQKGMILIHRIYEDGSVVVDKVVN